MFIHLFNTPLLSTHSIPGMVPSSAAISGEREGSNPCLREGWVILWGQVQRQLGHTGVSIQGHQESSQEGPLSLEEVTPLLSPEGRARGNQVKGGAPTLASMWHNSRGRCSEPAVTAAPWSCADPGWLRSRGGEHISGRGPARRARRARMQSEGGGEGGQCWRRHGM